MKHNLLLASLIVLLHFSSRGQNVKLQMMAPVPMAPEHLGTIPDIIGVDNGTYCIREADFGRKMDFKNNIISYVTLFNANNGRKLRSINMNALVAESPKGEDDIVFADLAVIKGKILGVYTTKQKMTEQNIRMMGVIADLKGKVIKKDIALSETASDMQWKIYLTVPSARKRMEGMNAYRFNISPDSTKILMTVLNEKRTESTFKIFDNELNLLGESKQNLFTGAEKELSISKQSVDNEGNVYVVTVAKSSQGKVKSESFAFHAISVLSGGTSKSIPLRTEGAIFSDVTVQMTHKRPVIIATYNEGVSGTSATEAVMGIAAGYYDAGAGVLSPFTKTTIPDSMQYEWMEKKKITSSYYLVQYFLTKGYTLSPDKVMAVLGQEWTRTERMGTTGAMDRVFEVSGSRFAVVADDNGKVVNMGWMLGTIENIEMATRAGRTEYVMIKDNVLCLNSFARKKGKDRDMKVRVFERLGEMKEVVGAELVEDDRRYLVVEGSVFPINDKESIGIMVNYDSMLPKEFRFFKLSYK